MTEAIRWTIKVSRETDLSLRTFLGAQGMKKGDLSRFVEEAVRWRILDQTVQGIKARNRGLSAVELDTAIDEAMREVRGELGNES
jgi:ribbon-helix-helix protein